MTAASVSAVPLDVSAFGRFEVLTAQRLLRVDGQPVALGSRAFDLLTALVARRDRVVPKDELIEVVWPGLVVEDNNLQVQISALCKILGVQAIATVPGRGCQFTLAASAGVSASAAVASAGASAVASVVAAAGTTSPVATVLAIPPRPERSGAAVSPASRVLVADDNKVNRLLLCRSLELMGHDVCSADNGRTALEKLRSEHFDLLLLDLEMPEVDGFGLLEQRATDASLRNLPVIVTSSLEGAAAVAHCIELGADDFLHKPVNPVLLRARVDSSLERKHSRDRERALLARLAPGSPDGAEVSGTAPSPRRAEGTLLVARLRDIGTPSASQSAAERLELLSHWSTLMLEAVEGHGGIVCLMAGDALTAPQPLRSTR